MQYLESRGVKIPFIFEKNSDFPIVVLSLFLEIALEVMMK